MSVTVVVPARDYSIPAEGRDAYTSVTAASGFLLLHTGDYLLLSTGDKLIMRGGEAAQAPTVTVPYRDYSIVAPERDTSG